ncbi:transmembrane protein 134 [Ictalurus furcatus]|uniref:transmembrane protein 134 n=1 Tax=Ictalurus furcatus TaxID=66913 RepID=UPI002350F6ED|nr:transmembrane protein 134 [Ictalurus furcatus]XP_053478140.1 transmembrane protein 134 [Ictalurus furcatus]XP_053478141.1 transmembrane protein 134 [Ictalurus furcatus]
MAKQFTIDDAFSLEGEEDGAGPEGDLDGWKERERERDGEMTFGPLTFSKPQSLPSSSNGTMDHSNLKYQNLENEEVLGSPVNSTFNNLFKISDPATLSYCSSQWSFSTLSSVTQLSAHCCGWTSHPLIKKNRRVVLASFLLLITGVALIFTGIVLELNPHAEVSSAIFFVSGFLLFIPGVYHVIYISCAVRGQRGFKFFYLPYFEK